MIKVHLRDAEGHLGQLIEEAASGEEVVITSQDGFTVRLVPLPDEAGAEPLGSRTVGHALDRFIGTWTAEEETELLSAVEVFERVDESFSTPG